MRNDPHPLISADLLNNNLFTWIAIIGGLPDSPYEGGKFRLRIEFPQNYPFSPPRIFSTQPIYHPNVEQTADLQSRNLSLNICITLTQKDEDWSAALCIEKVLLGIQSLLTDPNPHHAMDWTIAKRYLNDRAGFDETARLWTRKYAMSG